MCGVSVVSKTVREDRLEKNLRLFKLNNEHFDRISSPNRETGSIRYLNLQNYIGFDIFDELEDQLIERNIA